jgi:hypothetical protein
MPRLNKIQGKVALNSKWFSGLVDRVEEIKPLAGDNIALKQTTDGIIISSTGCGTEYELNVCINGEPGTLIVYGPKEQ